MKKTFGILLTILLGLAVGIGGAAWRSEGRLEPHLRREQRERRRGDGCSGRPSAAQGPRRRTEYNFGTLDISSTGSHDFIFTNDGRAPCG